MNYRLRLKPAARWIALMILVAPWGAALGQTVPVAEFGGTGDQEVSDVIIRSDGAQYVVGSFSGELRIGACPTAAAPCQFAAAAGVDAYVARIDANGDPVWVRLLNGAGDQRMNKVLQNDGRLYVVGTTNDVMETGVGSVGAVDTNTVFVVALDDDGTSATPRWRAAAQGNQIEATHAELIGLDGPELLVLGGVYQCRMTAGAGISLASDFCLGTEMFVAALDLPGIFSGSMDLLNEDWRWASNGVQSTGEERVTALAATPSGVVFATTTTSNLALQDLTHYETKTSGGSYVDTIDFPEASLLLRAPPAAGYPSLPDLGQYQSVIVADSLPGIDPTRPYPMLPHPARSRPQVALLRFQTGYSGPGADSNNLAGALTSIIADDMSLVQTVDLDAATAPVLEFYHHIGGQDASTVNLLQVKVRTDNEIDRRDIEEAGGRFRRDPGLRYYERERTATEPATFIGDSGSVYQRSVIELDGLVNSDGTPARSAEISWAITRENFDTSEFGNAYWQIDDVRVIDEDSNKILIEEDFDFSGALELLHDLEQRNSEFGQGAETWGYREAGIAQLAGYLLQAAFDKEDRRLGPAAPLDLSETSNPVMEICHLVSSEAQDIFPYPFALTPPVQYAEGGGVLEVSVDNGAWQRVPNSKITGKKYDRAIGFDNALQVDTDEDGDPATTVVWGGSSNNHVNGSVCQTSTIDLGAYKSSNFRFRLRFATRFNDKPRDFSGISNSVGQNGWLVNSLVLRDGTEELISTATDEDPPHRLLRFTDTLDTRPRLSYREALPAELNPRAMAAVDDSAILLAGTLLSSPDSLGFVTRGDFDLSPAATVMTLGAFAGRLNVINPLQPSWAWVRSDNYGADNLSNVFNCPACDTYSSYHGLTVTGNSAFLVGEFDDLWGVDLPVGTPTVDDGLLSTRQGIGGMILKLDSSTGELGQTPQDGPWLFGGRDDGNPNNVLWLGSDTAGGEVKATDVHTDGLGRLIVAGVMQGSDLEVGSSSAKRNPVGVNGFTTQVTVSGGPVINEDWIVGQPIRNGSPILDASQRPRTFRNGIEFDAYAAGILYYDMELTIAFPGEELVASGHIIPLSATDDPIELVWADPNNAASGAPIVRKNTIDWPTQSCTTTITDTCVQTHIVGAPVELNSDTHIFRQLYNAPEGGSNAQADPATGRFIASTPGYSVVRYEGPSSQLLFEVILSRAAADRLEAGAPRTVPIGAEIRPPAGYPHQPDRPGFVLNDLAYIDGTGTAAAYKRARRQGHIIPVNRTNPAQGEQTLEVAWYRINGRGVFWPDRVVAYDPRWPDEARGLILSAIEFPPLNAGLCLGPTIQFHNARRAAFDDDGVTVIDDGEVNLGDYSLQLPGKTIPLGLAFAAPAANPRMAPGESREVPAADLANASLCRDDSAVLVHTPTGRRVDQFGDPALTEVWEGGPVDAADRLLVRNPEVCLGNAERANPFSVGLEWQPAESITNHVTSCTEKIIIASQAGSEVSGRDFPTDLIISQYVDDGPRESVEVDGQSVVTGQNQLIELYNGSDDPIELSGYRLRLVRFEGSTMAEQVIIDLPMNQELARGEAWVLAHPENSFLDSEFIDWTDDEMLIDGNDAVVLENISGPSPTVVDVFGADSNPGTSGWISQNVTSRLANLARSDRVCQGDIDTSDLFEPHRQWQALPIADLSGVGAHSTDCIRPQAPLDPDRYINWSIYAQADPAAIGFNPNDEHALKAASRIGSGFQAAFALRSDFGQILGTDDDDNPVDQNNASEPYVLIRYQEPFDRQDAGAGATGFRVFKVEAINDESRYDTFRFESTAGQPIFAPYPLNDSGNCAQTRVAGESTTGERIPPAPFFRDYKDQLWARSASTPGRAATVQYWYPLADTFYFDDARPANEVGDCIPWMANLPGNRGGSGDGGPIITEYDIEWPDRPLQLAIGESLIDAKRGMPTIRQQPSVQVVFDQEQEKALEDANIDFDPRNSLVEYFDPLQSRSVDLSESSIPGALQKLPDPATGLVTLPANTGGYKLPFVLRSRLRFDRGNGKLSFRGLYREGGNDPLLLTNILSRCEAQHLRDFPQIDASVGFVCDPGRPPPPNAEWNAAIDALFALSRNPNGVDKICTKVVRDSGTKALRCASTSPPDLIDATDDDILVGYVESDVPGILERFSQRGVPGVLSAGGAQASGYVTIALNNDPLLSPQPVSLRVIKIGCLDIDGYLSPYQGQVHVIESDGVFDESLALRHSGDFAGRLDQVEFEWCIVADAESRSPRPPRTDGLVCTTKPPECEAPLGPNDDDPLACAEWKTFAGDGPEITIAGARPTTLSDNWLVARYRFVDQQGVQTGLCQNVSDQYSIFAGAPGATPREPRAQLAEGWIKRVVDRLNPFDTRVRDFLSGAANTTSTLIAQLGQRFEGDIPLVSTPDNLNSLGIIEAYETVLNRALDFIYPEGAQGTAASNNAVLLISTRLADLYTALANEAYADAQDPLIGLTRLGLGSIATETFNFKNQLSSLLEEELILLRGRDNTQGGTTARPVYNRLYPNFTGAEGQAAYALAYNITDQTGLGGEPDSIIDERDALALFPQGHGDAWGHTLQSLSYHYDLLRNSAFGWKARTENVLLNGGPLPVDYLDERKFAANAALKARIGAEIVDLTYRDRYTADPSGQWQGYKDNRTDRQWGVSGWATRAGQGAYFDWLTANTIIPPEHRPLVFAPEVVAGYCSPPDPALPPMDPFCDCDSAACRADSAENFRPYFCGLPENNDSAYCDCVTVTENGSTRQVCPLEFEPTGIQVIERGNVPELTEINNQYRSIQTQIDEVDRGLNPLGIARDAVPFDIDPSRVDRNETHFEQVVDRAGKALQNAAQVWDFANRTSAMLRFNQEDVEDLRQNARERQFDFKNRLIDIFGTPFPNEIGNGSTYPDGYDGPDLIHFLDVSLPALTGTDFGVVNNDGDAVDLNPGYDLQGFKAFYADTAADFTDFGSTEFENICNALVDPATGTAPASGVEEALLCSEKLQGDDPPGAEPLETEFNILTGPDFGATFVNLGGGQRRVTGRLQQAVQDSLNARIEMSAALAAYTAHINDIVAYKDQFRETYNIRAEQFNIRSEARIQVTALNTSITVAQAGATALRTAGKFANGQFEALATCPPSVVGLAIDVTSPIECVSESLGSLAENSLAGLAEISDGIANVLAQAKEEVGLTLTTSLDRLDTELELFNIQNDLGGAIDREPVFRLEVVRRAQDVQAAQVRIANILAEGQRLLVERKRFTRKTASAISDHRFKDIAFRQFRNEVIQKYRATFDLAARFVYLAAKTYDYETNLLASDSRAGQTFLTDIVRHRSIGQLLDGVPIPGSNGLSDSLGRMQANFDVLKGQMGFNNPQIETNRFSLRRELFDLADDEDDEWAATLTRARVMDLNTIPEFRKLARPFADAGSCPQPGLVIRFTSDVTSGRNFFGEVLEAGDSSYDASQFATKIRAVGAWFKDYDGIDLGVSETPRVYLLPVGEDVLRSANGLNSDTRLWDVVDQVIPVPFPIGDNDIAQPEWNPGSDSLSDAFTLERRIGRFRAYPFDEGLGFDQEFSTDSRLIGRSVWNSEWMLIIPGAALLGDADEGLDRFIYGQDVPGTFSESLAVQNRFSSCSELSLPMNQGAPPNFVGGVSDILLFFKTYAYSGNRGSE